MSKSNLLIVVRLVLCTYISEMRMCADEESLVLGESNRVGTSPSIVIFVSGLSKSPQRAYVVLPTRVLSPAHRSTYPMILPHYSFEKAQCIKPQQSLEDLL